MEWRGYTDKLNSDSEIIPHAYIAWHTWLDCDPVPKETKLC